MFVQSASFPLVVVHLICLMAESILYVRRVSHSRGIVGSVSRASHGEVCCTNDSEDTPSVQVIVRDTHCCNSLDTILKGDVYIRYCILRRHRRLCSQGAFP